MRTDGFGLMGSVLRGAGCKGLTGAGTAGGAGGKIVAVTTFDGRTVTTRCSSPFFSARKKPTCNARISASRSKRRERSGRTQSFTARPSAATFGRTMESWRR